MLSDYPVAALIPADDLERAAKFYAETLGLRPLKIDNAIFMAFASGLGTMIALYENPNAVHPEQSCAVWQVHDIEETIATLKAKGVEFYTPDLPFIPMTEHGLGEAGINRLAWFKDSEGNTLAVTEFR